MLAKEMKEWLKNCADTDNVVFSHNGFLVQKVSDGEHWFNNLTTEQQENFSSRTGIFKSIKKQDWEK